MPKDIDSLLPVIYDDLKRLARMQRKRFYSKKKLGTRSIVHEAYINIIASHTQIDNSKQLLHLTSVAMRNIIIDNARAWQAKKRGGDQVDIPAEQISLVSVQRNDELLALDDALNQLRETNQRLVDIVVCRFFGGLTQDETANTLEISVATIKRDWMLAKALLFQELNN